MRRWLLPLCLACLLACQEPEPQKPLDPDRWDPRHEAALNGEDGPPERREPEYTRASKSGAAGATLAETDREHVDGVAGLEQARTQHEARVAAKDAQEEERQARDDRWAERARLQDAAQARRAERALREALLHARPLRVVLERVLAHALAGGDLRAELRLAEGRAAALREAADAARARADRAEADAVLAERLHAAERARAQHSLRARREASEAHREALVHDEAALCAGEALRLVRVAFLGD